MAIDLSELIPREWIFQSESAGAWAVHPYSVRAMQAIDEHLRNEENDAVAGVRILIASICKRQNTAGDPPAYLEPSPEDIAKLSDADIERFAEEFLERNQNLILDSEEGPTKTEDQPKSKYLLTVLSAENKRQSAKLRDLFDGLKSRLGGILETPNVGLRSVTQDLLKQNDALNRIYGAGPSTFGTSSRAFEPIPMPENPTHKTNRHLQDMNERLESLIGFGENALQIMNGLQVAAAEFLNNFSQEAEKNSRAAGKAIYVGIAAVVISVTQILYTEFWRAPQDTLAADAALASLREDIGTLRSSLSEGLEEVQSSETQVAASLAEAISAGSAANRELLQSIERLLVQQRERDQALIRALEAMTTPAQAEGE